jgi:hypothetical protein
MGIRSSKGAPVGAIFVVILLLVAVVVAVLVWTRRTVREHDEVHEAIDSPEVPSLRYQVPPGQDPAVVLAALRSAGYTATADDRGLGDKALLITGPDGDEPDREAVREVLAGESKLNFEDDKTYISNPQFDDE